METTPEKQMNNIAVTGIQPVAGENHSIIVSFQVLKSGLSQDELVQALLAYLAHNHLAAQGMLYILQSVTDNEAVFHEIPWEEEYQPASMI